MPRWARSKRHEVLDEVLVENVEEERRNEDELYNGNVATSVRTSPGTDTGVHGSSAGGPVREPTSSTATGSPSRLTSVIMMYSPYIPSIEEQRGAGTASNSSRSTDIGNYYSRIDTEESVKCVVTSVLFCAVVILIVLVAVLKNPGM